MFSLVNTTWKMVCMSTVGGADDVGGGTDDVGGADEVDGKGM